MIQRILLLVLMLFGVVPAWGGELSLAASRVYNGELALLRWQGEPLSFGVVRFLDEIYYLYPDVQGAVALLPVALETSPGDYPLLAAIADKQGRTTAVELLLTVDYKERPQEHLSLPEEMVSPGAKNIARIRHDNSLLGEIFSARSGRYWTSFVRPVKEPVSSVFGKRRIMNGKPKAPHSGTDFRSPSGTRVHAISRGRVALAADLFYTGKTVVIDHGEGLFSLYGHLSKLMVAVDDELMVGEILGEVGSTGRSTGSHLHLTVKLFGTRIDPLVLLDTLGE